MLNAQKVRKRKSGRMQVVHGLAVNMYYGGLRFFGLLIVYIIAVILLVNAKKSFDREQSLTPADEVVRVKYGTQDFERVGDMYQLVVSFRRTDLDTDLPRFSRIPVGDPSPTLRNYHSFEKNDTINLAYDTTTGEYRYIQHLPGKDTTEAYYLGGVLFLFFAYFISLGYVYVSTDWRHEFIGRAAIWYRSLIWIYFPFFALLYAALNLPIAAHIALTMAVLFIIFGGLILILTVKMMNASHPLIDAQKRNDVAYTLNTRQDIATVAALEAADFDALGVLKVVEDRGFDEELPQTSPPEIQTLYLHKDHHTVAQVIELSDKPTISIMDGQAGPDVINQSYKQQTVAFLRSRISQYIYGLEYLVVFTSRLQDGTYVQTTYPFGQKFDSDTGGTLDHQHRVILNRVDTTLSDAIAQHNFHTVQNLNNPVQSTVLTSAESARIFLEAFHQEFGYLRARPVHAQLVALSWAVGWLMVWAVLLWVQELLGTGRVAMVVVVLLGSVIAAYLAYRALEKNY